jgi:hypothetical protein
MNNSTKTGKRSSRNKLTVGLACLAAVAHAQGAEPSLATTNPPAASAGLLNDWLRKDSELAKPWDLGGQLRLRYDFKENAGSFPNRDFVARGQDNSNDYLLERMKYHIGFTPEPWVTTYVEGRSSFEQWDKRTPSPESDTLDLHQGYIALGNPKQFPLSTKVGRQELVYGDERWVGRSDWSNTGRVFDAAKLRFENDDFWVDAFASRVVLVNDNHFNEANDDDLFTGVYASTQKLLPWQETQLYGLARNVGVGSQNLVTTSGAGAGPRDVYTIGTRWASLPGKLGGWDYGLELAGQLGSVSLTNPGLRQKAFRHDLEAFGAFVNGGYTWTQAWSSPRFGLGYDYGSGDDNLTDRSTGTFENLFGTAHRFYGQMDLLGLRNLHTPRLSTSFKPLKNLTIGSDYLLFWMADTHDYLYPESGSGRSSAASGYGSHPGFSPFVGSEIDVVATYAIKKIADLQVGYGHFFTGTYIEQTMASRPTTGGDTDADWVYIQTRFNF